MKIEFIKTGPDEHYARGLGLALQFGRTEIEELNGEEIELKVVRQLSLKLGLWFFVVALILWRAKS